MTDELPEILEDELTDLARPVYEAAVTAAAEAWSNGDRTNSVRYARLAECLLVVGRKALADA